MGDNIQIEPFEMGNSSSPDVVWELVTKERDMFRYGYESLQSVYFAKAFSSNKLPPPLSKQAGLSGKWIFCYPGNSFVQKMTIRKEFTEVLNKAPAYMYFQYYTYIRENNASRKGEPRIFVEPTLPIQQLNNEFPNESQAAILPSSRDFEWTEAVVEIDVNFVVHNIWGIEFGTENLEDGDVFVLKRLAIVYGKEAPLIEDFQTCFAENVEQELELQPLEDPSCCSKICSFLKAPFVILSMIVFPAFLCCRSMCNRRYRNYRRL